MSKKPSNSKNLSQYYGKLSLALALVAFALTILQQFAVDYTADPSKQSSLHVWFISAGLIAAVSFALGMIVHRDQKTVNLMALTALIISGFVAMQSVSAEISYLKLQHEQKKIMEQYGPPNGVEGL